MTYNIFAMAYSRILIPVFCNFWSGVSHIDLCHIFTYIYDFFMILSRGLTKCVYFVISELFHPIMSFLFLCMDAILTFSSDR
eukprot:UN09089